MDNIIGMRMYNRRKELGLTLEQVGQAVGVGKSTVRKWENGMIKNMGRDKIAALSKILQMHPVEFIPPEEDTDMMVLRIMTDKNIEKYNDFADKYQLDSYPRHLNDDEEIHLIYTIRQNEDLKALVYRIIKMSPSDIEKLIQMMNLMFAKEEETK